MEQPLPLTRQADLALERLAQANVHESIQARLLQFISEQELAAGDRLPSQSALAEALGVSTIALREAMRALEALGIIEARAGSGWYVRAFSFEALARGLAYSFRLNRRSFSDLLEIRMRLECSYLPEVVSRLTEADLDALAADVEEMEELAAAGQNFDGPDRTFHMRMFQGKVQNPTLTEVLEMFWELYPRIPSSGGLTPQTLLEDVRGHRLIVEALRQRDPDLAVRRLRESMQGAVRRAAELPLPEP